MAEKYPLNSMVLNDIRKELSHINTNLQSINKSLESRTEYSIKPVNDCKDSDHPRVGDVYEICYPTNNCPMTRFIITRIYKNDKTVSILYDDLEVGERRKWDELKYSRYLFHRDIWDLFAQNESEKMEIMHRFIGSEIAKDIYSQK